MLAHTRTKNRVRVGADASEGKSLGTTLATAAILVIGAVAYTSGNVHSQRDWNERYGGRK